MNHLVVLLSILASTAAQRPHYAGSGPVGIPQLASRFANTTTTTTTTPTPSGSNLANRVGEGTSSTIRIPTDALGDADLIKRFETWPRENQPFWYINADHVEKQRHPDGGRNPQNVPASNSGQGSSSGSTQVPFNNQNQSGQSGSPTVVNDRGSFDSPQRGNGVTENSFSVFRDNQMKTYVYDPVSDSWKVGTN